MALTVFVASCAGPVFKQAQSVAITGNPSKVEHCRHTGLVELTGSEQNRDDRWLTFREQAVVNGGNTVYLSSPGASVTGSSYLCSPPIRSDDAALTP